MDFQKFYLKIVILKGSISNDSLIFQQRTFTFWCGFVRFSTETPETADDCLLTPKYYVKIWLKYMISTKQKNFGKRNVTSYSKTKAFQTKLYCWLYQPIYLLLY